MVFTSSDNRRLAWCRCFTTSTRMLWELSFLFRFLFPHENSKTIGANYLTKENVQSILVLVVYDAIVQVVYSTDESPWILLFVSVQITGKDCTPCAIKQRVFYWKGAIQLMKITPETVNAIYWYQAIVSMSRCSYHKKSTQSEGWIDVL